LQLRKRYRRRSGRVPVKAPIIARHAHERTTTPRHPRSGRRQARWTHGRRSFGAALFISCWLDGNLTDNWKE
jgi:hypothetical protein